MREIFHLNFDWKYSLGWEASEENSTEDFSLVNIPHTNKILPYSYLNEKDYQFKSNYQKNIYLEKRKSHRTFIKFYGVQAFCIVKLNGTEVGRHFGGYDAFSFDLTPFILEDGEYTLDVLTDSYEDESIPPFGGVVDYLTYGGIYRPVEVCYLPETRLEDVFLYPTYENQWVLNVQCKILNPDSLRLTININIDGKDFSFESKEDTFQKAIKLSEITPWDTENPKLYEVTLSLSASEKIDEMVEKIGFRTCVFKNDGFYLNHKKVKLLGLNRHQSYPYVGYAMPKSMQIQDADILKYTLGCNLVRTSHYPQSQDFIKRCDEIGLLVFTELVGWQHISKIKKWRDLVLDSCENMIMQYRNHPSIILWGVRVNESQDDQELYTKTNAMAHHLDPTRMTGGVRFLEKSQLLEDVYTYNDFSHMGTNHGLKRKKDVTSVMKKPYLVTEHNGHMYPTKSFDDEIHRTNHAIRHANVVSAMMADNEISGAIGWCMSDYNTHKDFGSGDRICHHGVMNMFRMEKLASSVYSSQQDNIPVLNLNTQMQIGESEGGQIKSIVAFTNCDYIELYKNNQLVQKFYPDEKKYKAMNHPPIFIDDLIGNLIEENEDYPKALSKGIKELLLAVTKHGMSNLPLYNKIKVAYLMMRYKLSMADGVNLYTKYIGNWGMESLSYKLIGYKNASPWIEREYSTAETVDFALKFSATTLVEEETYDVLQVFIEAKDQNSNTLPYYFEPVEVCTQEGLEVYGPEKFTMVAGQGSFYLRSCGKCGNFNVDIKIGDNVFSHKINVTNNKFA